MEPFPFFPGSKVFFNINFYLAKVGFVSLHCGWCRGVCVCSTSEWSVVLKRSYSLKRNKEFRYVYRSGKSVGSKLLVLIYIRTKHPGIRIGFSVGKRIGNAVCRNRVKRRLREAVSPLLPHIQSGYRLIFIARSPITDTEYRRIESTVRYLVDKAELLRPAD